jgi:hypothetical protein
MKYRKIKSPIVSNKSFQLIKCECGAAFLIIPDAKHMGNIIDAHAAEHGLREQDTKQVKAKIRTIQDSLIKQVFEKASMM